MKPGSVQFLKRMFVDGECFDMARKTADFMKGMGADDPKSSGPEPDSEPEVVVTTGESVEEHQVEVEPAACSSSAPACSSVAGPGAACATERVGHGVH